VTVVPFSLRSGEVTSTPHPDGDPRPERPTPLPPSTTVIEADTRWQAHAACRGEAGENLPLFFPTQEEGSIPAKKICHGCPVRDECLEYALALNINYGIWGGLSINTRRKIRKERYRARLASTTGPSEGSVVVPSVARWSRPAPPASRAPRATHP
jgi:hypothetical protein